MELAAANTAKKDDAAPGEGLRTAEFNTDAIEKGKTQKHINDTFGGKAMHWLTYYGLGFVANGIASLAITYYLNPRPSVRNFKARATGLLTGQPIRTEEELKLLEQNKDLKKTLDSFRSGVEITFQFISGSLMTVLMMPLIKYKDHIAYHCNQLFGRDKEVVPECLQPEKKPETKEKAIEIELNKLVHKDRSNGDLWKSRIILMFGILGGDFLYNRGNRKLEEHRLISGDMITWSTGMGLYKFLPKSFTNRWVQFFENHGASVDLIRENMPEHYKRIEHMERAHGSSPPNAPAEELNKNSMVIGEQTRLISKEWFWTLVMAYFMDKLTGKFHRDRVKTEQQLAVADLRAKGVLTNEYDVVSTPNEGMRVVRRAPAKAEKSFADTVGTRQAEPRKRSFGEMSAKNDAALAVGA